MTVATAVVASARLREESRGAHWRDDFDGRRESWHGHLIAERDGTGGLQHHFVASTGVAE
jgi:L-aspartate oxidase